MKKYYECFIAWETENGTQTALAYCNAENKTEAKRKISNRVPHKIHKIEPSDLQCVSGYVDKIKDSVRLWYFDSNKNEHVEEV